MAEYRFWTQIGMAFALSLAIAQTGLSQAGLPPIGSTGLYRTVTGIIQPDDFTCKVYSLADLGDDPALCKWIAETIPQMIQPSSWKSADGKVKLSFYGPGKILVINHTLAVHSQVDQFIQELRKTRPQAKIMNRDPQVMPAQFAMPDNPRPIVPQVYQSGYPVPYPPTAPKHLFHFIIRYEGAGIIDSNVVKFTKAMNNQPTKSQCVLPRDVSDGEVGKSSSPRPPEGNQVREVVQVQSRPAGPIPLMPMADPLPAPRNFPPEPLPPLGDPQ